jgi:hypothetical protein
MGTGSTGKKKNVGQLSVCPPKAWALPQKNGDLGTSR